MNQAGIDYIGNVMLGVAGNGNGLENAKLTADFFNKTGPKAIWVGTLAVFEEVKLYKEIQSGLFTQAPEMENLQEEKELIGNISLENVRLYGAHPTNAVPISGVLPQDKDFILNAIDKGIEHFGEKALSGTFYRGSL